MPVGNWTFPLDLSDNDEYSHAILFTAYEPTMFGVGRPVDNFWLYVPGGGQNNLVYSHVHEYDDVKLSRLGAGIASSLLGVGGSATSGAVGQVALGAFRKAINPKIQVLYRSTELRTFDFSFLFAPQGDTESRELYGMLNRFRYYAAPEISGITSLLFNSPYEWTIDFRRKVGRSWSVNPFLPKIAKSICARIDVDMNPDSEFSTFENGDPTSARLTMRFAEMEIIDKQKIREGGY